MDMDKSRTADTSTLGTNSLRKAVRWHLLGLSFLGLAVGFFAGISRDSIVTTLLPLLFALLGGAGGLYLIASKHVGADAVLRLSITGKALALFSACVVLSAVYGILLRTGIGPQQLVLGGSLDKPAALPQGVNDAAELVYLTALRARLTSLGATVDEQSRILEAHVQRNVTRRRLEDLREQFAGLAVEYRGVTARLREANPDVLVSLGPASSDPGLQVLYSTMDHDLTVAGVIRGTVGIEDIARKVQESNAVSNELESALAALATRAAQLRATLVHFVSRGEIPDPTQEQAMEESIDRLVKVLRSGNAQELEMNSHKRFDASGHAVLIPNDEP